MPVKRTIKEKILATFVVLVLFTGSGIFLAYINFNNKKDTIELQNRASSRKIEVLARNKIARMEIGNLNIDDITAKAFLTLAFTAGDFQKVLAQKNVDEALPIASITKLMTAIVVREKINIKTEVTATADYVGGYGTAKILEVGRTYTALELLKNILISSDNDSARLLASILGEENFVSLMNIKAKELGMNNTFFVNTTGLDPVSDSINNLNISSASDLVKMILYINNKHPDIFQITRDSQYNFCDTKGDCYNIFSTNRLLDNPDFNFKIIGGKTGRTVLADTNLALIIEPFDGIFLLNIVLGSKDNFTDTKTIINDLKLKN